MKNFIIVTGSSRGIGEAIAYEFANHFKTHSHYLLIARDLEKLNDVKKKILAKSEESNKVSILSIDFSSEHQVKDYFGLIKEAFGEDYLKNFERLFVVYNHGTLEFGNVSLVAQESLRKAYEINLFSVWSLLGSIDLLIPSTVIPNQFHINISSGYSELPTANWSGHCTVRAARDMLFKCFALEHPEFRVLNYEPGIVYTDMLKQATVISPEYQEGYDNGKYTKPEDTAAKLLSLLLENSYPTGSKLKFHS